MVLHNEIMAILPHIWTYFPFWGKMSIYLNFRHVKNKNICIYSEELFDRQTDGLKTSHAYRSSRPKNDGGR